MSNNTLAQDIAALSPRVLQDAIVPDGEKAQIAIYNHIHSRIIPKVTREQSVPPLHVVMYAARTNLRPHLIPKQIPNLLDYLATVDCARQKAVGQMKDILSVDTRHKRHNSPGTLTSGQRKSVAEVKSELEKLRRAYRDVVCGLCLYHVYETGVMKGDVSNLLLTYFPIQALWDEDVSGTEGRHSFHYALTDAERKELELTVQVYLDLLAKFVDDNPPDLSPREFRFRYPCPMKAEPKRVAEQALAYLDKLEDAIRTVNSVLK